MKKGLRKNQMVLTALALMIAVAGYLTYAGRDKEGLNAGTGLVGELNGTPEISDEDILAENQAVDATGEPGEAVLTGGNTSAVIDFMAQIQLDREQVRTKSKETLLEIINNTNINEEQKQTAIDRMVQMTEVAERENATETLLSTKGFANTVVSINDDGVDVVIGMTAISDAERAQIEDIVKRKTELSADKIVISLLPEE